MKKQPVETKKAEMRFRKCLTEQHVHGEKIFPYELNDEEIFRVLIQRVKKSRRDFMALRARNVHMSPFLEIGAERCQRTALLINEFHEHGIATDISAASLKSAHFFTCQLSLKECPERIVCDAYNLPFKDGTFAFAFCYQTLHHFPDPSPILREIKRVLHRDGYFFFDEEPVKGMIRPIVYRRYTKPTNMLEKLLLRINILPLLSDSGKAETNYGIIEASFPLREWIASLSIFETVAMNLYIDRWIFLNFPKLLKRIVFLLVGSTISALAYKGNR